MKLRIVAMAAAAALLLAACGGPGDPDHRDPDQATPTATAAAAGDPGSSQGSGDVDCSVFSKDDLVAFVMYTQFLGQVRDAGGLEVLSQVGYTPEEVGRMLDNLDQLKGIESQVYGTPDEGLANFRTANDTFAEILAKGDGATDADFAPVAALWASNDDWIKEQAAITGALKVACPDIS